MGIGGGADAGLVLLVLLKSCIPAVTTDCQIAKVHKLYSSLPCAAVHEPKKAGLKHPVLKTKAQAFKFTCLIPEVAQFDISTETLENKQTNKP